MEDYERELYGVEDDFHSQFAAELEVLAELEGRRGHCRGLVPRSSTGSGPAGDSRRAARRGGAKAGRQQTTLETAVPCSAADLGGCDCVCRRAALDDCCEFSFRRDNRHVTFQGPLAHRGSAPPDIRGDHCWRERCHSLLSRRTSKEQQGRCQEEAAGR